MHQLDQRFDLDDRLDSDRVGAPAIAAGKRTLTVALQRKPARSAPVPAPAGGARRADEARGEVLDPFWFAIGPAIAGPGSPLPHGDAIQRSFGAHDVRGVRAHTGGAAAVAARGLGATAYATGLDVVFATAPDLHTAAHEAAHVIQQRAGRHGPGLGAADDEYERHADAVADRVTAGESAEALLARYPGAPSAPSAPSVQRTVDAGLAPDTKVWVVQRGDRAPGIVVDEIDGVGYRVQTSGERELSYDELELRDGGEVATGPTFGYDDAIVAWNPNLWVMKTMADDTLEVRHALPRREWEYAVTDAPELEMAGYEKVGAFCGPLSFHWLRTEGATCRFMDFSQGERDELIRLVIRLGSFDEQVEWAMASSGQLGGTSTIYVQRGTDGYQRQLEALVRDAADGTKILGMGCGHAMAFHLQAGQVAYYNPGTIGDGLVGTLTTITRADLLGRLLDMNGTLVRHP